MRCSGSNSLAPTRTPPRELALRPCFFHHRLATGEPRTALRARGAIGRIIAPDDPFRSALKLPTCRVTNDTKQLIDIMTYCL